MDTNGNGHSPGSLSTRAMLVGLSISLWGNRRMDKQISREASESRGMGEKTGRYNRWLLIENRNGDEAKEYKRIVSVRNKSEVIHREMTLPWLDNGTRINSARNYKYWAEAIHEARRDFEEAVDDFVRLYPHLVDRTKLIMDTAAREEDKPSMFNERLYPSQATVRNKFGFSTTTLPLPDAHDFRVELSDVQVGSIRQQIEDNMNSIVMDATRHIYESLYDLVKRIASLGDPKTPIQRALMRDVEEISERARRLNISEDSFLDALATRIKKELTFEPILLKTSEAERDALVDRALAIENDLRAFMGEGIGI